MSEDLVKTLAGLKEKEAFKYEIECPRWGLVQGYQLQGSLRDRVGTN